MLIVDNIYFDFSIQKCQTSRGYSDSQFHEYVGTMMKNNAL